MNLVIVVVQNLIGIGDEVLKICDFYCHASLVRKCLFTPLLGCFGDKNRQN